MDMSKESEKSQSAFVQREIRNFNVAVSVFEHQIEMRELADNPQVKAFLNVLREQKDFVNNNPGQYNKFNYEGGDKIREYFRNTLENLERENPQAAKQLVEAIFTPNPAIKEEGLEIPIRDSLRLHNFQELEEVSKHFREKVGQFYPRVVGIGRKGVAGEVNLPKERIDEEIQKNRERIDRFHNNQMEVEERSKFVDELARNRALRLGTIRLYQERQDEYNQKHLTDEIENLFGEAFRHMGEFSLLSPGSTYVSGVEFREDIEYMREEHYQKAEEALENLLSKGIFEEFTLENLWRLRTNKKSVDRHLKDRESFPQDELYGAFSAIYGAYSGTYRSSPADHFPPISPLKPRQQEEETEED